MLDSKFNKILWTTNGIGIFLVLIFTIVKITDEVLPDFKSLFRPKFDKGLIVGKGVQKAKKLNLDIQHLTFGVPERIADTEYYLSELSIVDKHIPDEVKKAMSQANDYQIDATINVLFFKDDRTEVYTLLEDHGYVAMIDCPRRSLNVWHRRNNDDPRIGQQKFILYRLGTRDTNGDSRINSQDSTSFYISTLNGKNLTQITPDSLLLDSYWYSEDYSQIYFEEILQGDKVKIEGFEYYLRDRKIYYYDFHASEFGLFEKLQTKLEELKKQFKN